MLGFLEEKSLFGAESNNDINTYIENPWEDLLKEKFVPGAKPCIDINSYVEKPCEGLFEKEKKEEGEIVERYIIKE